jgi:hypothetical protein
MLQVFKIAKRVIHAPTDKPLDSNVLQVIIKMQLCKGSANPVTKATTAMELSLPQKWPALMDFGALTEMMQVLRQVWVFQPTPQATEAVLALHMNTHVHLDLLGMVL